MPKPNPPELKDSEADIMRAIEALKHEVTALRDMETGQSDATKADLERQIKQRFAAQLYLLEQLAAPDPKDLADAQNAVWPARAAQDAVKNIAPAAPPAAADE